MRDVNRLQMCVIWMLLIIRRASSTSSTRVTSRPSITTQAHSGEILIAQGVGGGVGGVIGLAVLVIGVVLLIKRTRLYVTQMEAENQIKVNDEFRCEDQAAVMRRTSEDVSMKPIEHHEGLEAASNVSYQSNLTENLAYHAFEVENEDTKMAARQNPAATGLESDDKLLHLEKEASLTPESLIRPENPTFSGDRRLDRFYVTEWVVLKSVKKKEELEEAREASSSEASSRAEYDYVTASQVDHDTVTHMEGCGAMISDNALVTSDEDSDDFDFFTGALAPLPSETQIRVESASVSSETHQCGQQPNVSPVLGTSGYQEDPEGAISGLSETTLRTTNSHGTFGANGERSSMAPESASLGSGLDDDHMEVYPEATAMLCASHLKSVHSSVTSTDVDHDVIDYEDVSDMEISTVVQEGF